MPTSDEEYPGALVEPPPPESTDPRPVRPQFVADDEAGWLVPETGRWRPDGAGAF